MEASCTTTSWNNYEIPIKYWRKCTIEPSLSIIIPTYNSEKKLPVCLSSIAAQDYSKDKVEVIIVDGGSSDNTLTIAKKFKVEKVIHNPGKFEEIGRPLGIDVANHEIIAFIDSDNILPSPKWLKTMVAPFEDDEIFATEPMFYAYRRKDDIFTRYCSLIGADDPLYPYLGTYDRYCYFKERWTDIPMKINEKDTYLKVSLKKDIMPTLGANGFLIRKKILTKIVYKPFIHTDVVHRLVSMGYNKIAKVKTGIIHIHANKPSVFIEKKIRRIRKYFIWRLGRDYYPPLDRVKLAKFVFSSVTLIPLFFDSMKGSHTIPDIAWIIHPASCLLTTLTYSLGYLEACLRSWSILSLDH